MEPGFEPEYTFLQGVSNQNPESLEHILEGMDIAGDGQRASLFLGQFEVVFPALSRPKVCLIQEELLRILPEVDSQTPRLALAVREIGLSDIVDGTRLSNRWLFDLLYNRWQYLLYISERVAREWLDFHDLPVDIVLDEPDYGRSISSRPPEPRPSYVYCLDGVASILYPDDGHRTVAHVEAGALRPLIEEALIVDPEERYVLLNRLAPKEVPIRGYEIEHNRWRGARALTHAQASSWLRRNGLAGRLAPATQAQAAPASHGETARSSNGTDSNAEPLRSPCSVEVRDDGAIFVLGKPQRRTDSDRYPVLVRALCDRDRAWREAEGKCRRGLGSKEIANALGDETTKGVAAAIDSLCEALPAIKPLIKRPSKPDPAGKMCPEDGYYLLTEAEDLLRRSSS